MSSLHLMIFIPFIFAIIVPFIHRQCIQRVHTGWFVLAVPLSILLYLIPYIRAVSIGKTIQLELQWMPSLGINFTAYLDGLALIFALLISGIGALVILYSIYYLSKEKEALNNFYVYLLLFMGAMLGLIFSDNIFVLYVFWELTSISSFLLIAYWYQRKHSRYGAQKAMLITIAGGLAMLAGLILLSIITETNSIREMVSMVGESEKHKLFLPAMIFLLLGAFTKSAQFPFSIWLPDAMEAPTPISAYLHSATMVKAGIYLVARFTPVFGGSAEWFWLVSGAGIITLLYGSINAVQQKDLKALLAYSTVSQLGLIMSLLGIGSAALYLKTGNESSVYAFAVAAALFHLINHSTFKGSLFMVVGIIDHEAGTRDLRRLGGLAALMPVSFTLAVIGSFSMAGLPPFNGFLSKEMFFTSILTLIEQPVFGIRALAMLFAIVAWTASVFTFIYCMILVFKTFTGKHHPEKLDKQVHEAPLGMLVSPMVLASLVVMIFFFPNVIADYFLKPALAAVVPGQAGLDIHISPWHGWNAEVIMTLGVIGCGILLYRGLKKWLPVYQRYPKGLTFNHLYQLTLEGMEGLSFKVTKRYMTGIVRDYLVYIFFTIILVIGGALWLLDGISFYFSNNAPVNAYEMGIVVGMIVAALTVLLAKSRLTAIIALGALGLLVSLLFVVFRAPDLALTQLVVETVTTVLFLLCFYHLPELRREKSKLRFKLTNLLISLGVGAVFTVLALSANNHRFSETISSFFEDSYTLAGAKNMVNAILVDFRGLDTMLEILVLAIAGLGVFTLIHLGDSGQAVKSNLLEKIKSNDVILRTVTKAASIIIFTFAIYLFFGGHHNPGGGFVGGLSSAAGLILLYLTFDSETIRENIQVDFKKLAAAGVLIAVMTGAGSFLFQAPFLSQTFGHVELPVFGDTELATALIFDLGVALAVVGTAMTIILTISEDES
ncbi:Na+/H+ antiporter subunit A [Neobacillus kokaensis]|uniref:Na+/H+ antiporter subunit A n=1 Tax=Neobacillus kokaensis TaxID=2759023 RepID=A0ABQ3NAL1_9BACI|nr:Na+/H+ antiporter subunit A [Neobacillus kokaensis]GHI00796.1 Na+/H+ antiporter subunit A [Neobacillus kokaensis]